MVPDAPDLLIPRHAMSDILGDGFRQASIGAGMRGRQERNDGGWTLVEVMFVVLLIGILVSIAVASYGLTADRARRVACQENQRTLDTAATVFEQSAGRNPNDLAELIGYVERPALAKCPSGPTYNYDSITGMVSCPIHPAQ
jgi:general secretion pathway protein G